MKDRGRTEEQAAAQEPRFKSSEELCADPIFNQQLDALIVAIRHTYASREEPEKGRRYKRSWADDMIEKDQLNSFYFKEEIGAIWKGESKLPALRREMIQQFCDRALMETMSHYQKEEE